MAHYKVLMPWTNDDGEHKPGEIVEIVTETASEKVEVDKLVRYGIVEATDEPQGKESEPSSAKKK